MRAGGHGPHLSPLLRPVSPPALKSAAQASTSDHVAPSDSHQPRPNRPCPVGVWLGNS